jgi:hypothetical protein
MKYLVMLLGKKLEGSDGARTRAKPNRPVMIELAKTASLLNPSRIL